MDDVVTVSTEDSAGVTSTTVLSLPTIEEMREHLDMLVDLNTARRQRLAREFEAEINPAMITEVRLNTLLAHILDEPSRLRVEAATEATLGIMLDQTLDNLTSAKTRQTLLDGVPGVNQAAIQQSLAR